MPAVGIQHGEGARASGKWLKHFHQRSLGQLAFDDKAIGLEQARAIPPSLNSQVIGRPLPGSSNWTQSCCSRSSVCWVTEALFPTSAPAWRQPVLVKT